MDGKNDIMGENVDHTELVDTTIKLAILIAIYLFTLAICLLLYRKIGKFMKNNQNQLLGDSNTRIRIRSDSKDGIEMMKNETRLDE